jgi:predicted HTH transcriptional regulator
MEVAKPIPSQQVYSGTVFEMIDAAVDFVMSKLARAVVPSSVQVASDVQYEISYKVVREAIVNALAHRSYASKAGVQVMLFADRLEVWNPGSLPEGLTVDQLREPHHSIPRNRLLCEPLFLTHYIERAGTGTLDMISLCSGAGLPEPQFRSEGEHFVATIWRDWLTDDVLAGLGLNERQLKAVRTVKEKGEIASGPYQDLTGVEARTATRDLVDLVEKQVFTKYGERRSAVYRLRGR